jgi:hypothetical protein
MAADNVVESRRWREAVGRNLELFGKALRQPAVKILIIRSEGHYSVTDNRDYLPLVDENQKVLPKIGISWYAHRTRSLYLQ